MKCPHCGIDSELHPCTERELNLWHLGTRVGYAALAQRLRFRATGFGGAAKGALLELAADLEKESEK